MAVENGIGASVTRTEDQRFLTGNGCFGDDVRTNGARHAVVLRSPHAHATIEQIDADTARRMPGVELILTGEDLEDRFGSLPSLSHSGPLSRPNRDGSPMAQADQPLLAVGKVRYLGEPVALVVANRAEAARDAAEAIEVNYTPLSPVMTIAAAKADGNPIWHAYPDNQSFDWESGDAAATRTALDAAAHTVKLTVRNNRIAPVFMEPRATIGEYDAQRDEYTLHAGSQGAHRMQASLAEILRIDEGQLRVVTPDMGGGFGARGRAYPEMALVLVAARELGAPVRWVADRSESFLTDFQSRDHMLTGELGIDADGRFTALEVDVAWRHSAYVPGGGILTILGFLTPTLGGVYRVPTGYARIRGWFTNTTPLYAYRGIGRVEATYLTERLVDAAAAATGLDRLAIRRANMITDAELPYTTFAGARYEACTFAPHLERAIEMAQWGGFDERRRESESRGMLRGIGCAPYVENDGGARTEYARIEVDPDGTVIATMGTQNFGMGHETVFAQMVSEFLGVPFDCVRVEDGDTGKMPRGSGSHGSRSMRMGGTALSRSADALIERGRTLAAELLQTSLDMVRFENGRFLSGDVEGSVDVFQVARHANETGGPFTAEHDHEAKRDSYSTGCHVCEVEIDPDTGTVRLCSHVLVSDVGRVINPLLLDGQVHGGAAQGLGQAAMEQVVYDPDSGQTLTGSLMDYTLPRADDLPFFTTAIAETPETDNPLGVKGVGEGPTTGSPAAYMNAVHDAIASAGGDPVDMPTTPERVWRALNRRAGDTSR